MKNIAVLLTVHNRKEKTITCLTRFFEQEIPEGYALDIYLTDDGCTDGTTEAIREQFPQVHIVQGDGTLFWNRGMYVAWKAAAHVIDYNYYLWLNDDTMAYPYMLTVLLNNSERKGNRAIIVGATQSTDHLRVTYGGRLKDGSIAAVDNMQEVDHFNGNIVLIPQEVYKTVGNLDWYFIHSKGDFDYGLRARKAGFKIYQAGSILGECDSHSTLDKWCNPKVPLKERWKAMHRPNGMPPKETFYLERRHLGLFTASFHYCTVYMRCLFPWFWYKKIKL